MSPVRATIIIITRDRPLLLDDCLGRLLAQTRPCDQVIVVDSSSDDRSQRVLDRYPTVVRLRRRDRNNMPAARNDALELAKGAVVAFIDDDALVCDGWLATVVNAFSDARVGCVAGRLLEDRPVETDHRIGEVLADGTVIGNFTRVTAGAMVVEHARGANMAFRREVFKTVGKFDPNYTGFNNLEDTDMSWRVFRAGWLVLYEPNAVAIHLAVTRADYSRSNEAPRTQFYAVRNHLYFVIKNWGFKWPMIRRQSLGAIRHRLARISMAPTVGNGLALVAACAGVVAGTFAAVRRGIVMRGL